MAAEAEQLSHEGRALAFPHQPVENHERLQCTLQHANRRSLSGSASLPTLQSGSVVDTACQNPVAPVIRRQIRLNTHRYDIPYATAVSAEGGKGAPASAWHPAAASAACQSRSQRSCPAARHARRASTLRQHNNALVKNSKRYQQAQATAADGRLCSDHMTYSRPSDAHFGRVSPSAPPKTWRWWP